MSLDLFTQEFGTQNITEEQTQPGQPQPGQPQTGQTQPGQTPTMDMTQALEVQTNKDTDGDEIMEDREDVDKHNEEQFHMIMEDNHQRQEIEQKERDEIMRREQAEKKVREEGKKKKGKHLNIKVVNSSGAEVFFKIKFTTKLGKLTKSYCKRQGLTFGSVRFTFDGHRIDPGNTPNDLNMEEGDVVDAMIEQTGGNNYFHSNFGFESRFNLGFRTNEYKHGEFFM